MTLPYFKPLHGVKIIPLLSSLWPPLLMTGILSFLSVLSLLIFTLSPFVCSCMFYRFLYQVWVIVKRNINFELLNKLNELFLFLFLIPEGVITYPWKFFFFRYILKAPVPCPSYQSVNGVSFTVLVQVWLQSIWGREGNYILGLDRVIVAVCTAAAQNQAENVLIVVWGEWFQRISSIIIWLSVR